MAECLAVNEKDAGSSPACPAITTKGSGMRRLLIALLLLSSPVYAGESEEIFYRNYMLTTFTYGTYKQVFHMDKDAATIFSVATSLMVGVAWGIMDHRPDNLNYLAPTMLGSGFSVLTIKAFDF